jgi:hypothetical protein
VTKLTRRSFLQRAPVTAATLSVLPAMPAVAAIRRPPQAPAPRLPAASPGSMVIHVKDVAKGEMILLVGAQKVVLHDPWLVSHFIEAAR